MFYFATGFRCYFCYRSLSVTNCHRKIRIIWCQNMVWLGLVGISQISNMKNCLQFEIKCKRRIEFIRLEIKSAHLTQFKNRFKTNLKSDKIEFRIIKFLCTFLWCLDVDPSQYSEINYVTRFTILVHDPIKGKKANKKSKWIFKL